MNKILKVKCPQCHNVFEYYQSEFRPFCSDRCKMIDLGHWFKETYRVPMKENELYDEENNEESNQENSQKTNSEKNLENYQETDQDDEENY